MKNYTLNIKSSDSSNEVHAKGSLIINNIESIYKELKEKISADKELAVYVDDPESIDVTFFQLLVSLKKTWAANGKNMTLKLTLKDDIKQLIEKTGLYNELEQK